MSLFEVENLCVAIMESAGERQVVKNLSFSLKKGTIHGLVGQSGAGKTMTANALSGLLSNSCKITRGSICFKDKHFGITDKKIWKKLRGQKIFMMFQSASQALNPSLKIGIQIAEVLQKKDKLSQEKKFSIIAKLLNNVGLDNEIIHHYPFQLSGGMRQRVQIAIALALKPDILIADEPTTGLDSITQMEILNLLAKLKDKTGTSILFISHDLRAVSYLAETISVMQNGRIVETGSVEDIFRFPMHSYTKEMVQKLNEMENMICQNLC